VTGHLSDDDLATARALVPILCVDLVPVRRLDSGVEVGLILRSMPSRPEPVWCHLGGRVRRGETVRAALLRHLRSTLTGVEVDLPPDPQPQRVVQWFPEPGPVHLGLLHGFDPRQHAVALVHAVTLRGTAAVPAGGEGTAFRWWRPADLRGVPLWPGTAATVSGALGR
jgi:ADP-ribose pyrophosphatase YjhB (NUDIX family)